MTPEPLITVVEQQQPAIQTTNEGASRPVPTAREEYVADNVFSPEVSRLAATALGMHTGLALLHHIIVEAAPATQEDEEAKRRKAAKSLLAES